jgi:uncharacterized protein YjiS (DUF1127 family)
MIATGVIIANFPHATAAFARRSRSPIGMIPPSSGHRTPEEIMQYTDVVAHRSGTPTATFRDLFGRFRAWPEATLAFCTKAWTTRRDAEALLEMSDHQLKDIGIARTDIPRAVREGRI